MYPLQEWQVAEPEMNPGMNIGKDVDDRWCNLLPEKEGSKHCNIRI